MLSSHFSKPYLYTSLEIWLHVQANDLPPTGPHFAEPVLKHVILDFNWTSTSSSSTILYTRLSSQLGTTSLDPNNIIPSGHSLETMAMMTGLDKIVFALAQSHPLILSPKRIRWFCNTMRDNRRIAFSLLGIYRNASSPKMRVSMTQSIQVILLHVPRPYSHCSLVISSLTLTIFRFFDCIRGNLCDIEDTRAISERSSRQYAFTS